MGNFLGRGHDYKAVKVADDGCKDLFKVKRPFYTHVLAFFLDGLEKAVLWFNNEKERIENHYMLGGYAPVDEFGPERVLSVKGQLPKCLNGDFVRVGPKPKWKPVAKYHWFDGDGIDSRIDPEGSLKVWQQKYDVGIVLVHVQNVAWVENQGRKCDIRLPLCEDIPICARGALGRGGGSKFHKVGDLKGMKGLICLGLYQLRPTFVILDTSNGDGTANTAVIYHNGKLQALQGIDAPYVVRVLENSDLETVARLDYDEKLNQAFTAHPKIDPETANKAYVTYRVISKDGAIGDCVHITLSGRLLMHDFAITESYAIFMDLPLYFNIKVIVGTCRKPYFLEDPYTRPINELQNGDIEDMTWSRGTGMHCHSMRLNQHVLEYYQDMPKTNLRYTANAWEEGDEVVLIACRGPSVDLELLSVHDERKSIVTELWEYRFNLKTGDAKERQLGKLKTEFPRINEKYLGRKTQFVYTAVFGDSFLITGVVKYDLAKEPNLGNSQLADEGNEVGVYWHGSEHYGSEPVYVSKKPGRNVDEDDGYLLNFVFDEKTL